MKKKIAVSALGLSLLGISGAYAATTNFTWTGASSGTYSTAGNWTVDQPSPGTIAPRGPSSAAGDDFIIFQGGVSTRTLDLASTARNVRGLSFSSVAGANGFTFNVVGVATTVTSFGFNLRPDGIVNNDADTQTFNVPVKLFNYTGINPTVTVTNTINAAAGNLVFSGNWSGGVPQKSTIDLNGGTLVFTGSSDITVGGASVGGIISSTNSTGQIIKNGSGTLTFLGTSANSYTNSTIINAGTIVAGKVNALGNNAPLIANGGTVNIGANNQSVGAVTLNGGALTGTSGTLTGTSYAAKAGTIDAKIAGGSAVLTKTTTGTVTLTAANTYGGGTIVSNGTLRVNNTTGSGTGTGGVTVWGGTLAGSGIISGAVNIKGGATIAAGNSPGTLTVGALTLNPNSIVTFSINSAGGTAGADPGWSVINATSLDLTGISSGSPITVDMQSLTLGNVAGAVADFDGAMTYDWLLVHTTGGITGFDAAGFLISLANFMNDTSGGAFSVIEQNSNNDLAIHYEPVPEPSTIALCVLGGFGLFLGLKRRSGQ